MDVTLYRAVGNLNRIALGGLADSEFYTVEKKDDRSIVLTPVNIVDGASKRSTDDEESASTVV